ncbi:MAG: zf-HC2 domain-containing protein [Planctomycetota bacterium]
MTHCENIKDHLGPYLDGEVAPDICREVESHLTLCQTCADELSELRSLAAAIAEPTSVTVPSNLWHRIESRLEHPATVRRPILYIFRSRAGFALAASIAVVVGLGLFALPWVRDRGSQVQAATVDFGILLDSLQADAREAFGRFLTNYDAKEATPADAKRYATKLSFDLPAILPGGFELKTTYVLQFGDASGVAARYDRAGEFLGVLFHPPVLREDFGTHKDRSCVVGKHRGHKVPVGEWSLVHLTDPSTCHCVLSRLDEATELPAVMAAVAPGSASTIGATHDHHHEGP